ncbi:biotin transporter BioY [Dactylosporangium sp. AC04546]|uniref:biotin transporter BioY n=1 Tax=Dactylosporangium sp. AC04546 TaxID=2862460 RepID=UPI001EDF59AA|nr:biotin transporter BioY [Dactylosporangium sp. AC04546]WVK79187.1 biotin transporter BioY [Dactylosporangium sp. AC04546]
MATEGLGVRRPGVIADVVPGALVRDLVLVLGGAALTGAAAQVAVSIEPLSPVPLTGQTFAVLVVGAALGTARGLLAMLVYLAAGAAGLPWFAGGASGAAAASFGYVIGFVLAAAVVGELARRGGDRTPLRTIGTMLAGNLAIYAVGVPYLAFARHLSAGAAIEAGVVPFLLGDAIKVLLAAGVLPGAWLLVRRLTR